MFALVNKATVGTVCLQVCDLVAGDFRKSVRAFEWHEKTIGTFYTLISNKRDKRN